MGKPRGAVRADYPAGCGAQAARTRAGASHETGGCCRSPSARRGGAEAGAGWKDPERLSREPGLEEQSFQILILGVPRSGARA